MDKTEIVDFEGQRYVDPHLSQDERLAFANQLREMMGAETERIASQTKTLGTDVPSVQGGLSGANGYFAQRYQTTPVETQVRTLEAAARAKALNDLMSNYETQVKNRYNQAYRSAQRRANSNSGGGGNDDSFFEKQPFNEYTSEESITMPLEGWPEELEKVTAYGSLEGSISGGGTYGYRYYRGTTKDGVTGIIKTDNPNYWQSSNGLYYDPTPYMTDRTRAQALSDEMKRAFADRIARSRGEL